MKKIIHIIGITFLAIIVILNLAFTAKLDASEHITINNNTLTYTIGIIASGIIIYTLTKKANTYIETKENKKRTLIIAVVTYIIFNIIWVILVNPPIVGDQVHACNLAQTFYNNNLEQYLPNMTYAGIPLGQYMQSYHQQISLSFVFSIFFRIIHFDIIELLRVFNIIGNALMVVALYKISKQLSKRYEINNVRLFTLTLTFISIPMLSTFIYGDIPSLALCLFAIYFMMKYTETKKIKYPIFASICTMVAYMMRMNSLIFIIATTMYLIFNLFNEIKSKNWKENLIGTLIILMYIAISIIPAGIVQNYYLGKYNMDKKAEYPTISYILMAMEESWRGNGWYNEARGEYALKNIEKAKEEYVDEVKQRLAYFAQNPGYALEFYTKKLTSMWTENTYSAIRSNIVKENDPIENATDLLTFYQKVLLIVTCVCSIIFLIKNRKDISLEALFLITVFIGGFAFHILWEAKSRYIIPYIVVLIPVASIEISQKLDIGTAIKKVYSKVTKKETQ